MRVKNINACFILSLFLIFSNCQQNQLAPEIEVSRASLTPIQNEKPDDIAMIYDINHSNNTLIYKAVKVENSSGNPMRDALNAFFEENNIAQYYDEMRLTGIKNIGDKAVYSFTGKPKYQTAVDSAIFWKALDITIARNSENMDYIVQMSENQ